MEGEYVPSEGVAEFKGTTTTTLRDDTGDVRKYLGELREVTKGIDKMVVMVQDKCALVTDTREKPVSGDAMAKAPDEPHTEIGRSINEILQTLHGTRQRLHRLLSDIDI